MKVRDHSQHIGADGIILLKWILEKSVGVIHTFGAKVSLNFVLHE
jgi:hypothetical protein